ncbi:MAG: acylphosphatase [Cyanobium sp. CZS 25K]|nr:acylphosphatase [Cyanobium sp. CZS25K]
MTATHHERWRMTVRGLVQGVGYRVGCRQKATELGLSGWVRNRSDGSVELEAEGLPDRLVELRLWCEKGPQGAQVRSVTSAQVAVAGTDWFEIRT